MATYQSTHTGAEIDAGIDLLDKNSATQGQVLTANGTGGATWQNASGGSGGGFTPRLLYSAENITNMGGGYTLTREEMRFKLNAGASSDWQFTANVKCYLTYSLDGAADAGYKFLNSGESFGKNGIFTGAIIYIYPLEDYNPAKRQIGSFNGIPD